jgi:hypothetical protein
MKLREFGTFLINHLRSWWLLWASILTLVYLIYKVNSPIEEFFGVWIVKHVIVNQGTVAIDGWPPTLITTGLFVAVTLLGLFVFTAVIAFRANRSRTEDSEKSQILLKTFHRSMQAADLIAKQMFAKSALPIKKVMSCKQIYTLYEDGDCHFTEEIVLCAKAKDVHFIVKGHDADPGGASVEFPDEISLKVESQTPEKSVAYLINKNEPRNKGLIIFFLPVVKAGEEDQRAIKTTFYWKGLLRKLVERGEEEFGYHLKSVDPVPSVEYQFWVKPKMGHLKCTNVGMPLEPGTESLIESTDDKGMQGWTYKATNVPPDHVTELRLELEGN